MTRVVFAGPSLYGAELSEFGTIEWRSPAVSGDLLIAANTGASVIGLVDGMFEGAASVWHKEILALIDRGIVVIGGASIGALRAAECAAFGMVGVGTIFRSYADGTRTADADVAVLHAPEELGFQPVTLALVDVEETVARLVDQAHMDNVLGQALLEAAQALSFRSRTWDRIVAKAELGADATGLSKRLKDQEVSVKRADALAVVQAVCGWPEGQRAKWADPAHPFCNTDLFWDLETRAKARVSNR